MDRRSVCTGSRAALNKKASIVINDVTSSVRPMKERFDESSDYPDDLFLTGKEAAEIVGRQYGSGSGGRKPS